MGTMAEREDEGDGGDRIGSAASTLTPIDLHFSIRITTG